MTSSEEKRGRVRAGRRVQRRAVRVRGFGGWGIVLAIALASSSWRLGGADVVDERASLPRGFCPGGGSVALSLAGRPLELELPAALAAGERVELAGPDGITLGLEIDGESGSSLSLVWSPERGERRRLRVSVTADFGPGDAAPARFAASARPDVAFLRVGTGGAGVGRGFFDASGRAIDCGETSSELRFEIERTSSGTVRVTTAGEARPGRELTLLRWRARADGSVAGARPPGRAGPLRAVPLAGWRVVGIDGERLATTLARLAALPRRDGRARLIDVGDGWQGGGGPHDLLRRLRRDWWDALGLSSPSPSATVLSVARVAGEPEPGAEDGPQGGPALGELAVRLRQRTATELALWIMPFGQTSSGIHRAWHDAFLHEEARGGNSPREVAGGALGDFVVDPTAPLGRAYLERLGADLTTAGFRFLRLGGLDHAVRVLRANSRLLARSGSDPVAAVAAGIAALRHGAGPDVVLLGDWGTPWALVDKLDAVRPLTPDARSFTPLELESRLAARWYSAHGGTSWIEVQPFEAWELAGETPREQRALRSHFLFAAITGRGILLPGRATLSERVQRFAAATDSAALVTPVDRFRRTSVPEVWCVRGDDRNVSTVGVFNFGDLNVRRVAVAAGDLGLRRTRGTRALWFDIERESFIEAGWQVRDLLLLPGESRLFAVAAVRDAPVVVAVGREWLRRERDLVSADWSAETLELGGVVAGAFGVATSATDPAAAVTAGESTTGAARADGLRVHVAIPTGLDVLGVETVPPGGELEHRGPHLAVRLPPSSGAVRFRIRFERTEERREPAPGALGRTRDLQIRFIASERRPLLEWDVESVGASWRSGVFEVLRDGEIVARTTDLRYLDRELPPPGADGALTHTYAVRTVGVEAAFESGEELERGALASAAFVRASRRAADLASWSPSSYAPRARAPSRSRSAAGGPLVVGGQKHESGWGVRAPSRLEFALDGAYAELSVGIGIDDAAARRGRAVFVIEADGREVFRSDVVKGGIDPPREIAVNLAGVMVLGLVVEPVDAGDDRDLADWCSPRLTLPRDGRGDDAQPVESPAGVGARRRP